MTDNHLQIELAERLRKAIDESIRRKQFRSLNAVARAAGVDRSQLARFMNQERGIDASAFMMVCRVLGMDLAETVHDGGRTGARTHADGPRNEAKGSGANEHQPTSPPERIHQLQEAFEADLDPEELVVWRGKCDGLSNAEIARRLECSKLLVEKISQQVRKRWEKMFESERSGA